MYEPLLTFFVYNFTMVLVSSRSSCCIKYAKGLKKKPIFWQVSTLEAFNIPTFACSKISNASSGSSPRPKEPESEFLFKKLKSIEDYEFSPGGNVLLVFLPKLLLVLRHTGLSQALCHDCDEKKAF